MAVTTTPQDIIFAAYAKSKLNVPGTIASETSELLQLVIRAHRGLYALAARVNPEYFGEQQSIVMASGGWPRPAGAESLFRIELPVGTEVVVVPFNDRACEPGLPAVYEFGQVFRPASANVPNPQSGNLVFYYSKRPISPATITDPLDPLWPEDYNELLVLEVALYLAIKDGRGEEIPGLTADRDAWARKFVAHLEHATPNVRRRTGHIRRFSTNTLVPLYSVLAGGQAS